jgi:hypothetical protein
MMICCIYSAFHFVTLEEYYSGYLYLPIFNPVSDGSIAIILLDLYTAYHGNNFWATPYCDGTWLNMDGVTILTYGQVFGIFISACTFLYQLFK